MGAWAYRGTAHIFGVPFIISGTGKATNFKFCTYIHRINRKKSPLKIPGKVASGHIQGLPKIFKALIIYGTLRRQLYDSSAFLFLMQLSACLDYCN